MIKINISSSFRYPVDRSLIRTKTRKFLSANGLNDDYQVHIVFIGDRKMAELNKKFMGREGTCKIISFPLIDFNNGKGSKDPSWPDKPDLDILDLGEIVISFPQAVSQARKDNITVDDYILFLVRHGLKHLLGQHHE